MKILSSFTHPQVVPSMYEFISSPRMSKTVDFHNIFFLHIYGAHQLFGYQYSQNIFHYFDTGLEQLEDE